MCTASAISAASVRTPIASSPSCSERGVVVMQGNYDVSIGHDLADCGCGYTDPRDNHYAQLSYDYTRAHTLAVVASVAARAAAGDPRRAGAARASSWPTARRARSTSSCGSRPRPTPFLARMLTAHECDVLLVTHTGIPWQRAPARRAARGQRRRHRPPRQRRPPRGLVRRRHRARRRRRRRRARPRRLRLAAARRRDARRTAAAPSSSRPSRPAGGRPASRSCRPRSASPAATRCAARVARCRAWRPRCTRGARWPPRPRRPGTRCARGSDTRAARRRSARGGCRRAPAPA